MLQASKTKEKLGLTFWCSALILIGFLLWAPFQRGLFNGYSSQWDGPIYSSFIWASIILFISGLFIIYHYSNTKSSAFLLVWLLPITYLISLTQAASKYFAMNMVYMHVMYAAFFAAAFLLGRKRLGTQILTAVMLISGYAIVVYGLFGWFGNDKSSFFNHIMNLINSPNSRVDNVMIDTNGYRLTSVFQYANTYGAYLIAFALGCVYMMVKSRKWYSVALNALFLVPILISLMLTLSRGALVVLPVILLIVLFFLPVYQQILMMAYLLFGGLGIVLILGKITTIGQGLQKAFNNSQSLKGWLILLSVTLGFAILSFVIHRWVRPLLEGIRYFGQRRYARFILPIIALVAGTIGMVLLFGDTGFTKLLPNNLKIRLENINFDQHSVLERGTFYKDSLKLVKDYPLFGAGGGAWAALYEKYQNNPYTSRQAHSFIFQYLVEVGIVGTLILVLFIGLVLYQYIRRFIRSNENERSQSFLFFIIPVSLLAHSLIDFNFSYVYIAIMVFTCLGVLASGAEPDVLSRRLHEKWEKAMRYIYPSVFIVLSLIFFFFSTQLLRGNQLFNASIADAKAGKPFNQVMDNLNKAIDMQPYHPDYLLQKVAFLNSAYEQSKNAAYDTEAKQTIDKLIKVDPHNRGVLDSEFSYYVNKGQQEAAVETIERELKDYPWEIGVYQNAISLYAQLGDKARTQKNKTEMDRNFNHAMELYNEILKNVEHLATLPKEQNQGREFGVTPVIATSIGTIHFILGQYPEAEQILRTGLDPKLPTPESIIQARWYLASLQRQGKNDQLLMNTIASKNPNELKQVSILVNNDFSIK